MAGKIMKLSDYDAANGFKTIANDWNHPNNIVFKQM